MTRIRIQGGVELSWMQVLESVSRHASQAPVNELAEYHAEVLRSAANDISSRIQQAVKSGIPVGGV